MIELVIFLIGSCNESVLIHIRGGDFLRIKHLNICKFEFYKKSINYFLSKGINNFKVISADQNYAKELIKELKNYFTDLQVSIVKSETISSFILARL